MGFWLLTRYEDCAATLRSPKFGGGVSKERLCSMYGEGAVFAYTSRRLSNYDPPDHTRLRSLVTKAFTARRVESLRRHIQSITDDLLDAVRGRQMELMAELAHPLPSLVISEMLGAPEADRLQLSEWTSSIHLILGPVVDPARVAAAESAAGEFMAYVAALAKERRAAPGDDLLSALLAAEEGGGRLSWDELVATVVFLFSAGHGTTRDLIGNAVVSLLRHPDQWTRLVHDSALIPAAVEETLRYESPVTLFGRKALENTSIRGTPIAAGDQVFLSISAANRDPGRFTNPDRFDLGRRDNEHLAFGGGIHYCLGAMLARTEAQIVLGTLLRRYPRLTFAGDAIEWRDALAFRGPKTLRVIL